MTTDVRLRNLTREDAESLFKATNNDWTIHHELLGFYCYTIDDAYGIIEKCIADPKSAPYVIYSEENNFIGMIIVVTEPFSDTPSIDVNSNEIEISSFISKLYRGNGFGLQALQETFKLYPGYRVWFRIDSNNTVSIRVMKKIGARFLKREFEENYYYYDSPSK